MFIEYENQSDSLNNSDSPNKSSSSIINDLLRNDNHFVKRGFAKSSRRLLFKLIFVINLFNHLDHGAIAACTTYLMAELSIDQASLGFVGSLVYLGLTIGSSIAGKIFNIYTPKWIISVSIFISCFFIYTLTSSSSLLGLSLSRVLCGFFQVFSMIYFPVWIDQFGIFEERTIWLSFLQLGPALGTMLGYAIEAIGIKITSNWRIGFYFQIAALIIGITIFLLTPDKTFSRNYKRTDLTRKFKENNIEPNEEIYKKFNIGNASKYNRISDFSIYELDEGEVKEKVFNYKKTIESLWNNGIYFYTLSGLCCLFLIITGIEFWITDYMVIVLKQNENKVFITFATVCITAPTAGVVLGGYIIEKLGGYADRRAIVTCFSFSLLAGICGLPLPLANSLFLFSMLMWFTLFFGGIIIPGLTGILLNSIDENFKEESNSITHFCYNFFGYLPAPFLYGLVCNLTGGNTSRWGLIMLMGFIIIGVYCFKKAKDYQQHKLFESTLIENGTDLLGNNLNESIITIRESSLSLRESTALLASMYGKSQKNIFDQKNFI